MQNNSDKNIVSKPTPYRIILIVDDEPDITSSLKMGLEYNGFEVHTFNDPIEALSNFKAGSYDLVLLDIKMPKMNGFELCKEIKKEDEKVKICFLSAFEPSFEEFRKQFPELNVRCFASKPISIYNLTNRIKEEIES
jgi:two-component system, OmpR family, response regulator ChvI